MSNQKKGRNKAVCYRCGRTGHWVKDCFARVANRRKKVRNYAK